MPRLPALASLLGAALLLVGCTGLPRRTRYREIRMAPPDSWQQPAAPRGPASVLRDGTTGLAVGTDAFARLVAGADVIAFGEFHDDPEGAKAEAALWAALRAAPDGRPGALALEFFERDTQQDLDAYLAGTLPEADLVKRARQGAAYPKTHRPLVEAAKEGRLPVIAANAPRKLVTAYRKQAEPYEAWKATLTGAERAALPRSTTAPEGPYRAKFLELMGAERGPAIFKAQALWDDAMAEAVADHRAAHPTARVLLVVGAFHVEGRLGTLEKYAARRPQDRVALVVMTQGDTPALDLPADARGQADLVLVVPKPPDERTHP